jgi:catechol 2,3-dioxygenase-like lactoylglutathione lyase family enzyme
MVKVSDIAYGRLQSPDLDLAEEFLTHFGLLRSARTPNALYMRGSDEPHHIHVTELGEPRLLGFAYELENEADLVKASLLPGASSIEDIDEPGGGRRVRLVEPNGYQIEIVHGIERLSLVAVERQLVNSGAEPLRRANVLFRPKAGPTPVKRIAHAVLSTPKVEETVRWFQNNLGFIASDEVYDGGVERGHLFGSFCRVDRGDEFVDHHGLACIYHGKAGLNHFSFEVPDIDAVFLDHDYLKEVGKYEHLWGVGRHFLGSQVFDYWADPWGRVHEHWADSDRLTAEVPTNKWEVGEGLKVVWGQHAPEHFNKFVRS